MVLLALVAFYLLLRKKVDRWPWFLRLLPFAMLLPYLANSAGWILTEVGRQPWIVYGLMKTEAGISPTVSTGARIFSLAAFAVLYGVLLVADIYLLAKYARQETPAGADQGA
jgi:cytochrome d ubiquinol oxidase subunit I